VSTEVVVAAACFPKQEVAEVEHTRKTVEVGPQEVVGELGTRK
jgi:hypothetical protein